MKGSKPSLAAKRVAIASLSHFGDCIQTLPLAAVLKEHWPSVEVVFVASEAMKPLFDCCASADGFLSSEEVLADFQSLTKLQADVFLNPYPHLELAEAARKARIPVRVGNLRRTKHIRFCNRFVFYGRGYNVMRADCPWRLLPNDLPPGWPAPEDLSLCDKEVWR